MSVAIPLTGVRGLPAPQGARLDWTMPAGAQRSIRLACYERDGSPIDVAGATVAFKAAPSDGGFAWKGDAVLSKAAADVEAGPEGEDNVLVIALATADTAALADTGRAELFYDIRMTLGGETDVLRQGRFAVVPSLTSA